MNNTLSTNTMRYGFDVFSFRKQALIIDNKPLSAKGVTNVEGFAISGQQPADSSRKVIFMVDGTYFKLSVATGGAATPVSLSNQNPTIDSVLAYGNTVDELNSVTSIDAWVNKEIYPAIVLDAAPDATAMPTIKLGLKIRNNQDQYQKEEHSAEYNIGDTDAEIITISAKTTTTGSGTATVYVSYKTANGWSDWKEVSQVKNVKASNIKFKTIYNVSSLTGGDSAKVDSISCIYTTGTSVVTDNKAELITTMQEYDEDLSYAQCIVKHKKLQDAVVKAYVTFRAAPKKREMINIGIGTDAVQSIKLGDNNINNNSLKVQVDGQPITDFGYNTTDGEVTLTVAKGAAITASYEYDFEPETWQEMEVVMTQSGDDGIYTTKFQLNNDLAGKSVSAIKVSMERPTGKVQAEKIGVGNGTKQLFVLDHFAKAETINCSTINYSYDADNKIFTVVAPNNEDIIISYDWVAETQELYGVFCGWAE